MYNQEGRLTNVIVYDVPADIFGAAFILFIHGL